MLRKIKNIILISLIVSNISVYAEEIENTQTLVEVESEVILEENNYIKPIKINNRDITSELKTIDNKLYIRESELKYYADTYYNFQKNGDDFTVMINKLPVTLSLNSNYIYAQNGYIYTSKPLIIDFELYIPLEAFVYILDFDYIETDEHILIDNFKKDKDYSFTENKLVAHAMGGIDNITITNSLEAFLENYEKGFRVFEVDLQYTIDGKLVAVHDFGNPYKNRLYYKYDESLQKGYVTYEEFKNNVVFGGYTPLDFADIINLMKEYEDIYIITDTKYTEESNIIRQFNDMIEIAKEIDERTLNRLIPQLYTYEMYDIVDSIYDFNSYVMTLYMLQNLDYNELANFVYEKGIGVVTMDEYTGTENLIHKLSDFGVKSYIHTINDIEVMDKFIKRGAYGFYSDFINPINDFIK